MDEFIALRDLGRRIGPPPLSACVWALKRRRANSKDGHASCGDEQITKKVRGRLARDCYTHLIVTPLNTILGSQSSAILVLAAVGVVLLAAAAATLDYLSGTSRVLAPLVWERPRLLLFILLGLPATFLLIGAGGLLGALASGMAQTDQGTQLLLLLVNIAFVVVVLVCGSSSPLPRHWGLGIAAFAVGLGAVFPLLALIAALSFNDSGLLTGLPDRIIFGIATAGIGLAVALCGCAIVSMVCYIVERTIVLLRSRHHFVTGGARGAASGRPRS